MRKTIQIDSKKHKFLKREAQRRGISIEATMEHFMLMAYKADYWADLSNETYLTVLPNNNQDINNKLYGYFRDVTNYLQSDKYIDILKDPAILATHWHNNDISDYTSYIIDNQHKLQEPLVYFLKSNNSDTTLLDNDINNGYTYIGLTGDSGVYKVGMSKKPIDRMNNLSVKPLIIFKGCNIEEYLLDFYHKRIVGLHQLTGQVDYECRVFTKYDIINIIYGLNEYVEHIDHDLLKEIVDFYGFFHEEFPITLNNSNFNSEDMIEKLKKLANIIGAKNENIDRFNISPLEAQGIKRAEEDISGLIKYGGVTTYEELKNRLGV